MFNKNIINKDINFDILDKRKRRIATPEGALNDFKGYFPKLCLCYRAAISETESLMRSFPPGMRLRNLEASVFQSCIAKQLKVYFPRRFRIGKYGRLILYLPGYILLFKKLNDRGMPMNIKTNNSEAITNQLTLSFFEDERVPIIFFGYQKDKWGHYMNPQLVYIDYGNIQFSLTESMFELEQDLKPRIKRGLKGSPSPRLKNSADSKSNI